MVVRSKPLRLQSRSASSCTLFDALACELEIESWYSGRAPSAYWPSLSLEHREQPLPWPSISTNLD